MEQKADRVKATLHRSAIGSATVVVPVITATTPPSMMSPDEALQVLALAQRTAENHVTAANRHAQQVRSEAQASAERIRFEALAYAETVRAEADRLREEARAAAEVRAQEADAQAAGIRAQAESALAVARAEAERIVAGGQDRAEQLDLRAQQRYEDAVGSLAIRREALQKQIEALAVFDASYRERLASFMHTQLRALWIEQSGGRGPDVEPVAVIEVQVPGGPF